MLSHEELARIPLFASLAPTELDYLASTVPDIHVPKGEYIAHEGGARCLIIVVEGKCEITKVIDGVERFVAHRLPGTIFGEVPIVLNSPLLASLKAAETSRVIRLEPKVFHTLAAIEPKVSAMIGALALERIGGLKDLAKKPSPDLLLIGPRNDDHVRAMRTFLHRNRIELEQVDSPDGAPRVELPDGRVLENPTIPALATAVGLSIAPSATAYDLVIIGGGPAGMAAAVYGASEGLRCVVIERQAPGGQAGTSSRIENYLGFPHGVSGDELSARALHQARRLGAEIVVTRSIERMDVAEHRVVLDGGDAVEARTIVLATGVTWRRLDVTDVDRFVGKGVFYGAMRSEATSMQGRDVFLIGAGNSAGQAAMFLANHAKTVTLLVRADALAKSMSHYLMQQLATKPNIRVELNSELAALGGDGELAEIEIHDRAKGERRRVPAGGVFIFIGADAATEWLPPEIARDEKGYVVTGAAAKARFLLETSVPGVFAAGDVRAGSVKRVAAAVGDGSLAVTFVRQYLER